MPCTVCTPVSYTHLDVYKRQDLRQRGQARGRTGLRVGVKGQHLHAEGRGPVSYTHLGRAFRGPACTEAAAQGAALLAGWGSGIIARGEVPTPREAAAYAPDPALAARAEAAYRRYRRLYAACLFYTSRCV